MPEIIIWLLKVFDRPICCVNIENKLERVSLFPSKRIDKKGPISPRPKTSIIELKKIKKKTRGNFFCSA